MTVVPFDLLRSFTKIAWSDDLLCLPSDFHDGTPSGRPHVFVRIMPSRCPHECVYTASSLYPHDAFSLHDVSHSFMHFDVSHFTTHSPHPSWVRLHNLVTSRPLSARMPWDNSP